MSVSTTRNSRFYHYLAVVVVVIVVGGLIVVEPSLPCGFFAGLLLGAFLIRLSQLMQRVTRLPYWASLLSIASAFLLILAGIGMLFGMQLAQQLSELRSQLAMSPERAAAILKEYGFDQKISDYVSWLNTAVFQHIDTAALAGGLFSSLTGVLGAMALVLFVGIFLAVDPALYERGFLALFPKDSRSRAAEVLEACTDTLWWWMIGRLVAMTVIGIATALGLLLLGIPMPIILGVVAGILSFVPTIGAILAIIPALLVSFQVSPLSPLYVLVFYLGIQAVEGNLITPLVQQQAVKVPPVVTISSQFMLGVLVGIIGVAVATPMAAVAIVLVRMLYIEPFVEPTFEEKGLEGAPKKSE